MEHVFKSENMTGLKIVVFPTADVVAQIKKRYAVLENDSLEELVEQYNRQTKCGIVGVKAQGIFLIALHHALIERIGQSPITLEDKCVVGLTGRVVLDGGVLRYEDSGVVAKAEGFMG